MCMYIYIYIVQHCTMPVSDVRGMRMIAYASVRPTKFEQCVDL